MRKAILAIGGAFLFALGVGAGILWSRIDTSDFRNTEEVHSRILEEGNMPGKKWPKALAAFTPEAIENNAALSEEALKRLTWEQLSELVLAKDILDERLRYAMLPREGHISTIMSLSADDLETYVRDKKPEWEFAKTTLQQMRGTDK